MRQLANEAERSSFDQLAGEFAPKVDALNRTLNPHIAAEGRPRSLALTALEVAFKAALDLGVKQPAIFFAIGQMCGRLIGQAEGDVPDRAIRLLQAGFDAGAAQGAAALKPRGRA